MTGLGKSKTERILFSLGHLGPFSDNTLPTKSISA
jgi:hypothetical protein